MEGKQVDWRKILTIAATALALAAGSFAGGQQVGQVQASPPATLDLDAFAERVAKRHDLELAAERATMDARVRRLEEIAIKQDAVLKEIRDSLRACRVSN